MCNWNINVQLLNQPIYQPQFHFCFWAFPKMYFFIWLSFTSEVPSIRFPHFSVIDDSETRRLTVPLSGWLESTSGETNKYSLTLQQTHTHQREDRSANRKCVSARAEPRRLLTSSAATLRQPLVRRRGESQSAAATAGSFIVPPLPLLAHSCLLPWLPLSATRWRKGVGGVGEER